VRLKGGGRQPIGMSVVKAFRWGKFHRSDMASRDRRRAPNKWCVEPWLHYLYPISLGRRRSAAMFEGRTLQPMLTRD
jgi:hypothetical protein